MKIKPDTSEIRTVSRTAMTVSFVALFVGLLVLFFEDSQLTINIVNNKTRKYLFIIIIIFFLVAKI